MKPLVIHHHNCIDGFTAAFVAWDHFRGEAEFLPAQYGEAAPNVIGRDVLIVDFSYQRDVMLQMQFDAHSIRVLDHHRTAEENLRGLSFATFDMDRSGAGLAWDVLHEGKPRPLLVDYVEDRDLWRFKLDHSKEINAWIGAQEQTFETWQNLRMQLATAPDRVVDRGRACLCVVDRYVREMKQQARMVHFEGHDVPVVNAPYINTSELVSALAEGHPFAVGWFQRADGRYQYSLRSRGDFDVSALARKFGGGGHKNAAGFESATRVL